MAARRHRAPRAPPGADHPHHLALHPLSDAAEHANVARVRGYARAAGLEIEPVRFPATTRTAADAAREIGVDVAQIVKSLVFLADGDPVVVLCSGSDRVDEAKVAQEVGARIVRRATANEAKAATGYPIGGVPPFAHATQCRVIADERLLRFDVLWAAAGLPDVVFAVAPAELVRVSGASVRRVASA